MGSCPFCQQLLAQSSPPLNAFSWEAKRLTCTGQGAACHACSHDGCITTLCQCQQARQTVHNPGASWSQLLSLQIKLEELSTDARIVEMLNPPRTWSHVGTWTLGLEHLLMELVPKDKAYAIQRMRAALQ